MKHLILGALLCLLSVLGYTQEITVLNNYTQEAIVATIVSEDKAIKITTNQFGKANLKKLKDQKQIEITADGFIPLNINIETLKGKDFTLELVPIAFDLDEFVISTSKWKQKKQNSPTKVYSIPLAEIQLQNPQTAADLLGVSGRVFIQKSQQGGGSPMIRGFATNRLVYTIDGVRMNSAIFRGGNIQNVISLDPFAIEHTEVLLGPGSVLYGSDAIGGVMSFQTLKPQLSTDSNTTKVFGSGTMRYSTANQEKTANVKFNVGWKKWAMATSFSSSSFDDLRMGSKGPEEYLRPFYVKRIDSTDVVVENEDEKIQAPSGYSQLNLTQKVRFSPNNKWDFNYGLHYSETSSYSRYDRHIRYRNGAPRYGEWAYGPQTWQMHHLEASYNNSTKLFDNAKIALAYQQFGESRISRDFNKAARETRTERVDAYSLNIDLLKHFNNSDLFYGIESVVNQVFSEGEDEDILTGIKQVGSSRYPRSTWSSNAVYINYQHSLSEKVQVQGGARYNLVNLDAKFDTSFYPFPFTSAQINNAALTGNIGFVYHPSKSWNIGGSITRAFRSPNVDDVGKVFDSSPGNVVIPNPTLNPEYSLSYELNTTKVIGGIIKLELAGYYTQLSNALVRRNFQLNGLDSIVYDGELSQVQAIQNAATANVYGVEFGVELKFGNGFMFMGNLNYQKGEEELDDGTTSPSRHVAPFFGVARLEHKTGKITNELYVVFNGEMQNSDLSVTEIEKDYLYAKNTDGLPYSPAWQTVNFKTRIKATKNINLSAGIENIFDVRYRPYSSGITAAGRNFIISANLSF